MVKNREIGIIGATIWGNRGAEAMLATTIGQLEERFGPAVINVFSYHAKRDAALNQNPHVKIFSSSPFTLVFKHFPFALLCWLFKLIGVRLPDRVLPASVAALRRSEALLDINGITFADGRQIFLPFNILMMWPALMLGVPVIKLAQAMGPFNQLFNRLAAKLFLTRCRRIYARGHLTAGHLRDLGLPASQWQEAPDIAFLYDPVYSLSKENADKVEIAARRLADLRQSGRPLIALIPSSVVYNKSIKHGRDYVGAFTNLINELAPDYDFVLLPNATREGLTTSHNNDLVIIDAILDKLHDTPYREHVHAVTYDINTAASRRLLDLCDAVLSSRFHGMISALCLKKPVAVIGWSHKYTEVLEMFDLAAWAVDFNDPDLDFTAFVRDLLASTEEVQSQIMQRLDSVKADAARQFEELGDYV